MSQMKIAVLGASGRMGQMLIKAVDEAEAASLFAVTERPGHDWIGKDLGVVKGGAAREVIVADDPLEVFAKAEAVIDFTSPNATISPRLTSMADASGCAGSMVTTVPLKNSCAGGAGGLNQR